MKYNYIIYHKNCPDGFSSLMILILSKRIVPNAIIWNDVPNASSIPKEIEEKDVIIMDVAYKYEILKEIIFKAKSVVFIDHHITIHDDVINLKKMFKNKINIIYDVKECGASLTWKFLFNNKKMPLFIKYIKDNDIGTWKYKNTKPFITCLRVKYGIHIKYIKKWKELFDNKVVKKMIKIGEIYEEYSDALLNENSKKYSLELFPSNLIYDKYHKYFKKPAQYRVAVVCGLGCPSTSSLGSKIMETVDCDFVILWSYNMINKEYVLAFRSKIIDVGTIAQMFGGGGHKLASACSFSSEKHNIQDLFFEKSLERKNK